MIIQILLYGNSTRMYCVITLYGGKLNQFAFSLANKQFLIWFMNYYDITCFRQCEDNTDFVLILNICFSILIF